MEKLDVIASFDWMDEEEKVGTLGHEYLRGLIEPKKKRESTWLLPLPFSDSLMATDKEQEKAIWIL